jgi:hypothetical protein
VADMPRQKRLMHYGVQGLVRKRCPHARGVS